jgi:Mlc titration factor MtfA (ptsG expression regulator)
MQETLQQLRYQYDHHRKPSLFTRAATENLTELFAYASELYFCRPDLLCRDYPGVYDLLKKYYRMETKEWFRQ